MHRFFGLALAATLASVFAIQAQPKGPPAKHFTNRFDMKFVWIPSGTFVMGSSQEEKGRQSDETQHKVTLTKGFYMGVHPVTERQWTEIMGNNPSKKGMGGKNYPANAVSWDDCQDFIKTLRQKDKRAYRLPTEAEWEFCCRAGTKTPFSFGETISTNHANYGTRVYRNCKGVVQVVGTTPVDHFSANAWGLYDMHGNVWQWCQDWYGDYPKNAAVDPQGPTTGKMRVIRGGSWRSEPTGCRSAHRKPPAAYAPGTRVGLIGVRLCFTPE